MGVGKTERLGHNDSRFVKGRRVDEANDRILRNLKVKGGKLRRRGDKWTIEVNELSKTGTEEPTSPVDTNSGGRGPGCGDCCNYKGGCDEPVPVDCTDRGFPDGSGGLSWLSGGGWGYNEHFDYESGKFFDAGSDGSHDDNDHPGKKDPCL